jgi:hypothetical protein
MRAWYDWLVAGVAALAVMCLLFGAPPWVVAPEASVVLSLPLDVLPSNVAVSLKCAGADGPSAFAAPYPWGEPAQIGANWRWRFRWRPQFRGIWFMHHVDNVFLTVKPAPLLDPDSAARVPYPELREGLQVAVISAAGVRAIGRFVDNTTASQIVLIAPAVKTYHVQLRISPDPAPDDTVSVDFKIGAKPKAIDPQNYDPEARISLPAKLVEEAHKSVDITATGMPSGKVWKAHWEVEPDPAKNIVPLTSEGAPTAKLLIPASDAGDPFTYKVTDNQTNMPLTQPGSSSGAAVDLTVPLPKNAITAHVVVTARGKSIDNLVPLTAGGSAPCPKWSVPPDATHDTGPGGGLLTPIELGGGKTGNGSDGGPGGGKTSPGGNHPGQPKPLLPLDEATNLCTAVQLPQFAQKLSDESAGPNALILTVRKIPRGNSTSIAITPNKACFVQVYDIHSNGKTEALLGTDGDYRLAVQEEGAWEFKANTPRSVDYATSSDPFVVIAREKKGSETIPGGTNLLDMMREESAEGWTIKGVK